MYIYGVSIYIYPIYKQTAQRWMIFHGRRAVADFARESRRRVCVAWKGRPIWFLRRPPDGWCVCVHVCMYVCMHACMHAHTCIYIYIYELMCVCVCVCVCVCACACIYVCIYIYIYRGKGALRLAARLRREQATFVFEAMDTDRTEIL